MNDAVKNTDIVIAGIGQTPVGEHWQLSLKNLAYLAYKAAVQDSGGLKPDALYVGNMLAPVLSHQAHLGVLLADDFGLAGIEAAVVESGNAGGAAALRLAYLAVASGCVNIAMALGVEKFTDQVGPNVEAAASVILDSDYEAAMGLTPNAQAALLLRRYLYEYQVPRPAFGAFPILAHNNAAGNPQAMYRNLINAESYAQAGMVCDPLNLFDISPWADGAAAVIVARRDSLPAALPHPLARISGASLATDRLALHDRPNPLFLRAAQKSVERACRQAGILPQDVDFFELCDSTSTYAALSLEAAGFAAPGQGWRMAQDGQLALDGKLPVCTLGGFKGRGNPGGAAGLYQVVEAVLQLRGEAGKNQLPHPQRALVQSLSGAAATAVAHGLEVIH